MKIFHLADLHIRERDEWCSLHEQEAILMRVADHFEEHDPCAVLACGDIFERSTTEAERLVWRRVRAAWSDYCPVYEIRGNHDSRHELPLYTGRDVLCPEMPGAHHAPGLVVFALPYPSKGFVARHCADADQATAAGLRQILAGFGARDTPGYKRVLMYHGNVSGALADNDQPLMPGQPHVLSADDLRLARCDYYALGHIHKHQSLAPDMRYPGSPRMTKFGGTQFDKGFTIVDLDTMDVQHVSLGAPVLQQVPLAFNTLVPGGDIHVTTDAQIEGTGGLQLVARIPDDEAGSYRRAIAAFAAGLRETHGVKVDHKSKIEVIRGERAARSQVRAATGLLEKALVYYEATGREPYPRIKEALGLLEE